MSIADENVLREMRLLKRNASKAIITALKKSKLDTLTIPEMDELKGEVEPLIELLENCANKHLELLDGRESNHEEMMEWENEAEGTHIMWAQCLDLWRPQREALDKAGKVVQAVTDARGSDLVGSGSALSVVSDVPDAVLSDGLLSKS